MLLLSAGAVGLLAAVAPASAQNFFDFLFGGVRNPPPDNSYTDPTARNGRPESEPRNDSQPSVAYCVRLCDGRYFPIQRSSGVNSAQACSAFCPASRTKVFWGSAIGYATANDGQRYSDLPNAFAYRDRTVGNCTCNGKDAYGLVTSGATTDPTLQPGDIVATEQGFLAYTGGRRADGDFTPIDSYAGLSAELRQRLKGAKIVPNGATAVPTAEDADAPAGGRRAQRDR